MGILSLSLRILLFSRIVSSYGKIYHHDLSKGVIVFSNN